MKSDAVEVTSGKWCLLRCTDCSPLSSCHEHVVADKCKYEFEEEPIPFCDSYSTYTDFSYHLRQSLEMRLTKAKP